MMVCYVIYIYIYISQVVGMVLMGKARRARGRGPGLAAGPSWLFGSSPSWPSPSPFSSIAVDHPGIGERP